MINYEQLREKVVDAIVGVFISERVGEDSGDIHETVSHSDKWDIALKEVIDETEWHYQHQYIADRPDAREIKPIND